MTENYVFPSIDKSYWKENDNSWIEKRKRSWEVIEKYYCGGREKTKKGMNIIKRYYLKGEVPDFELLRSWTDETTRHLDLYSFLWLHPSKDKILLTELRNQYVNSALVLESDVRSGLSLLFDSGSMVPTYESTSIDIERAFDSGGYNLLMFSIILGDVSKEYFPENSDANWKIEKFNRGYQNIIEYGKWLCVKQPSLLSEDCLYQYDEYLQYWIKGCSLDSTYFQRLFHEKTKPYFVKALHRINRFEVEKEGDTARGRFAHKIRKLLDEHEFHPTLKELWAEVKSDTNDVKGLWRL